MKIAVIGSGISGMTAAHLLSRKHQVTLYEAASRLGGHTATIDIHHKGQDYKIDTGFIVFNDWTYPNFKQLLAQLGVDYQPTSMGFSVCCEKSGLEYSGGGLNTLFAQRSNLLSIKHWRMIFDILRFNKESLKDVDSGGSYAEMTLLEYLNCKGYSTAFRDNYLIPMGAAIWSASTSVMQQFPLQFFVKFFRNHGLLSVKNRPQWHVIQNGSSNYIEPLVAPFKHSIKLNCAVKTIERQAQQVVVKTEADEVEHYDQLVIATHSDQALSILSDASEAESQVLGAIPYQQNEVVLHTDINLLPKKQETWSSWNYRIVQQQDEEAPPVLTYNMNILQSINAEDTFCVTLNKTDAIDPKKVLGVYNYSHPVFSIEGMAAQQRWSDINGVNRTWFCGAYWANGFHEDGVASALRVTEALGVSL